mmetsp:Transcript_19226/g.57953  ORF Transcript_19226/g.57953 Transcript_19226/m.57953 type:complete len:296 (-) Transcript_19226:494-1381(-)
MIRLHGPVRDGDLHVQQRRDGVRDKDPADRLCPSRHGERHRSNPCRVDDERGGLYPPVVHFASRGGKEQRPRLHIEVEPGEHHDRVEEEVLVGNEESLDRAEVEDLVVVRGQVRVVKDLGGDGKNGQVLDIGVVFNRIAHDVVRVVRALPPARRDAHERVANRGSDTHISVKHVRHARVAEVVPEAGELLPEDAHHCGAEHVRSRRSAGQREVECRREEGEVPGSHLGIVAHVSLKEAAAEELLPNSAEVFDVLRHGEIGHLSNQEGRKQCAVDLGAVVVGEDVCAVLACHVDQR